MTFRPRPYRPLLLNGDAQTVIARYWRVPPDDPRFPARELIFETEPGVKVLAHENRRGNGNDAPILLILHGLAASSIAPYVRRLSQSALAAGYDVVRPNVRNCGDTEHLSPTLYHSGLTADVRAIVDQLAPAPVFIAGFSMGGNIALKLAGEWGAEPPRHVHGICGISVPIRLGDCSRQIGLPRNRLYERRFMRMLRRTFRRKQQLMPERYGSFSVDGVRSLYEFDQQITAPVFGFADANDYYEKSSAAAFLPLVRVPSLLIQAADDPFIPPEAYADPVLKQNPSVQLLCMKHGGHVAFLSRQLPRFWAEQQALAFFSELRSEPKPPHPTL